MLPQYWYWFAVKVCVLPMVQVNVCGVVIWDPSTSMEFRPDGLDAIVMEAVFGCGIWYTALTVSEKDGTV